MASRWALAAGVVGALLVTALLTVPFLTEQRSLPAAIPQPPPLFSTATVAVDPRSTACLSGAAIDSHSEEAQLRVGTRGKPAVPFALSITGRGYASRARVPAGYADNAVLTVPISPPRGPVLV